VAEPYRGGPEDNAALLGEAEGNNVPADLSKDRLEAQTNLPFSEGTHAKLALEGCKAANQYDKSYERKMFMKDYTATKKAECQERMARIPFTTHIERLTAEKKR
jgi:hypothetical protein